MCFHSIVHPFLLLRNIPWYGYATVYLTSHHWRTFGLFPGLAIMNNALCRFCVNMFSCHWDECPVTCRFETETVVPFDHLLEPPLTTEYKKTSQLLPSSNHDSFFIMASFILCIYFLVCLLSIFPSRKQPHDPRNFVLLWSLVHIGHSANTCWINEWMNASQIFSHISISRSTSLFLVPAKYSTVCLQSIFINLSPTEAYLCWFWYLQI